MKLFLLFLLTFSYAFSAPAFNKLREFNQADGTSFQAKANGDRYLNWIQTKDAQILKFNAITKNYEYVIIENNNLKLSGIKYEKNSSKKAKSFKAVQKLDMNEVYKIWQIRKNSKLNANSK